MSELYNQLFGEFGATQWFIIGLVLMLLELFLPGVFLIWFGIAALLVGVMAYVVPVLPWQVEVVLFALLSVGTLWGYRLYRRRVPAAVPDQPLLNRRAEQLVGRVFLLQDAIVNGRGKVKVGDALWTVTGAELAAGTRVRVIAVRDLVLEVEAA
jgi:membrane protein implicated in regulation of membrane protease activity